MDLKKDTGKEKKSNNNLRDILYIVVSALLAWLGCYLFTMRLGIITSFPFIIVTSVVASFVVKGFIKPFLFFALFGFLLPFMDSRGVNSSVSLCILCGALFAVSYIAVYLFRKKGGKAALYKICSVVLIAAAVAAHVCFNSDPFTFSKNKDQLNAYIETNYKYEKLKSSDIYYDFAGKSFITETAYAKRPTERAFISVSDGKISDGYIRLTEGFMLESPVQKLTEKLRKAFPDGKFSVTSGSILNYPRDKAVSAENTYDYSPYASFNIYFNSSMHAKEFIGVSEKYYNAILESGFECHDLVFYAGSAGKYYAKIETRFLSMKARFDSNSVKSV